MKKCKCKGKKHEDNCSYKSIPILEDSGFPTHSRKYKSAHKEANREEKDKFGAKQYHELDKLDRKLPKHELSGKNTKSGKIEVSEKVPKNLRNEVAYHEKVENKQLRKKK